MTVFEIVETGLVVCINGICHVIAWWWFAIAQVIMGILIWSLAAWRK